MASNYELGIVSLETIMVSMVHLANTASWIIIFFRSPSALPFLTCF